MGDWVPHGLEAEDIGLPRPGCRLTALLCAPDLLPTEVHVRSRFSAGLLRRGFSLSLVSPVDGPMIARENGFVIKPVVEVTKEDSPRFVQEHSPPDTE